jgi:hypothetical protein
MIRQNFHKNTGNVLLINGTAKTQGQSDPMKGYRKIGIEDVLQHVNDKIIASKSLARMSKHLPNNQFAAGVPGAQTALSTAKLAHELYQTWNPVRLDATNAFETMSLAHIVENLNKFTPEDTSLLQLFIDRFRRTPFLAIAGNKIGALIGDGTVQGFAVGPLLYAIGQSDALRAATLAVGESGVIIGLSDDVAIMREGAGLVVAMKVFEEKSLWGG